MSIPSVAVSIAIGQLLGTALPGATVRLELSAFDIVAGSGGAIVAPEPVTVTLASDGTAVVQLFPNVLGTRGTQYKVTVYDQYNVVQFSGVATVPNAACNLHDVLNLTPPPAVDPTVAAMLAAQAAAGQTSQDRAQTGADRIQTDQDVILANGAASTAVGGALTAVAQAALATVMAASAASVAQQDLSAVLAQALHRGPNNAVATCFMDTSKDSNPGWPAQVDASYLYETLNGAWIPHPNVNGIPSEVVARALGGTLNSTNLVAAAGNTTTGWSAANSGTLSLGTNNRLRVTNGAAAAGAANWTVSLTAGQVYVLYADLMIGSSTAAPYVRVSSDGGVTWNVLTLTSAGSGAFTASVTGNYLVQFGNANANLGYYFEVGNFHLHQVTAFAPSGSYYPNATDGKFYRLWKNLVKAPLLLSDASWNGNASVTTAGGFTDPAGGTAAFRLTATAANANKYQSIIGTGFSTMQATHSMWVRRVSGTGSVFLQRSDGQTNFDITASLSGTWQRFTAPASAGTGGAYFSSIVIATSGDVIEVAFPQVELGTVATTEETGKAVSDGFSQSETFRGNKARAPRLGLAVAEASRVVVYDLLEPGRPMWIVFAQGSGFMLGGGVGGVSLAYSQGKLAVASAAGFGMQVVDFSADRGTFYTTSGQGVRSNTIAQRNVAGVVLSGTAPAIASATVNAVAMTMMPDAPVDPVTGLQVPTIAAATAGGVSVIKHDGSVVSSASAVAATKVILDNRDLFWITSGGALTAASPGSLGASFAATRTYTTTTFPALLGAPSMVAA